MSDILRSPSDLREWECLCVCVRVCSCVCACQQGGSEAEGGSRLNCCFTCGFQLKSTHSVLVSCLTFLTRTPFTSCLLFNFNLIFKVHLRDTYGNCITLFCCSAHCLLVLQDICCSLICLNPAKLKCDFCFPRIHNPFECSFSFHTQH